MEALGKLGARAVPWAGEIVRLLGSDAQPAARRAAQKAIEAAVRSVHFKDGSQPSVEEMAKMGPLEMRTVVRVLSYIASIKKRTRAQSRARTAAMRQSQSDEARDTFLAFVEGRKYDGVHVCTTLARGEKSWPAYWEDCLAFLQKNLAACRRNALPVSHQRFCNVPRTTFSDSNYT